MIKYLSFLCILLWGGYIQLPAHSYTGSTLLKDIKRIEYATVCAGLGTQVIIQSTPSGREKEFFIIDATEVREEEDEHQLTSIKKNLTNSYFISWAKTVGYLFSNGKISWHKDFTYSSSHRYIIFQVFRI